MINFKSIQTAVRAARGLSEKYARQDFPFVRSRGTFLCTGNHGGQCAPNVAADCPTWRGTKREIVELVALVEAEYPDVTVIYIEGAYDGADTLPDLYGDNYEPRVDEWEVQIWERGTGFLPVRTEDIIVAMRG